MSIRQGNGWDLADFDRGARLTLPIQASGPMDLELRFEGKRNGEPAPPRRLQLIATSASGAERQLAQLVTPSSGLNDWVEIRASITLAADERLVLEALDPLTLQSVRGFVPAGPPAGWRVSTETADAVLLVRQP